MSAGGASDEMDGNQGIKSLLAQLRKASNQDSSPVQQSGAELISNYAPYHRAPQNYYGQQSSNSPGLADSFATSVGSHLPAAPTPPANSFPNAQFPPTMLGPIGPARVNGDPATSSQLLNLLKFSSQGSQSGPVLPSSLSQEPSVSRDPAIRHSSAPLAPNLIHAPAPAPSDPTGLLAALMKGTLKDEPPKPEPVAPTTWHSTSESNDTQQYLLSLLNRPKPSQSDGPHSAESSKSDSLTPQSPTGITAELSGEVSSSLEHVLAGGHLEPDPLPSVPTSSFDFESPKPKIDEAAAVKPSMFTYNNPFDDLAASSPLSRTPKTSTTPSAQAAAAQPIQILRKPSSAQSDQDHKRSESDRSPLGSPEHKRRKPAGVSALNHVLLDQPLSPGEPSSGASQGKGKDTVAVDDLAEADEGVQEALALVEQDQAQAEIAHNMDNLMNAKSDKEFDEAARIAGQAIKKELEKEENDGILESTLDPETARFVKDVVNEAADGPVVDSWESADQDADEIVVIEEVAAPVKVYNFPMKPWIAITVQEDKEDVRPVFRDESVLDIARLKKEFDQMDRNLVTASETYIGYGMSKAGGLRVIRQVDGQDAKLFTDTKDRIFNISMSSAIAENSSFPKDAIIGTGISGTVYWVQIRVGDKDHLEDANPEQYGFALPPISSQEGDTPGGVLKTRARTSSSHPEYFAVGRGKSIHIIWPGFIMQNNLFKPGHDRVVDTEKLSRQCSLRINTGKAGKDFTFSQDDTVVVSLDKSGRVKFWDVRDLTAAAEGSDPRNPMPAETSLEVKEPLMTLTTTPEGEKAWPTSVLLLDKLRPYQKRCALRYMVVGMKQNHTLQLWDLALGKPVQEFNLPHSKESDAVCSVMYHPPSGMIIVGHPTRNSIYFLHLSAPKYNMKNLSQVDYIQRLTAQDSSVPQPESTAVISGIREYSFATKWTLLSLANLSDPSRSGEGGEQTLFELYAMHSKGVTCLFIKQSDLGWSKDNKVVSPVDAVETGVVKIGKLKSLPQLSPVVEPHAQEEPAPAQIPRIIASRSAAQDVLQTTPSQDDTPRKGPEPATPAKAKPEPKEEEQQQQQLPVSQPAPSADKPEKKSRKKKAANPAAQAERDFNGQSNGGSTSPRVAPAKNSDLSKATLSSLPPTLSQEAIDTRIDAMETRICQNMTKSIGSAFDDIKKDIDGQFRARDREFEQKQGRLLDMVSDVLNSNTELVLGKIIREEFDKGVVPVIRGDVEKLLSDQLVNKISPHVSNSIQREVQKSLPPSVSQALKSQDLAKAVADRVAHATAAHVDELLSRVISDRVTPAVSSIAGQAVQRVAHDINQQASEHILQLEQHIEAQNSKIDSLMSLVTRLSDTVSTVAASHAQYQNQLLTLQALPAVSQPQQPQQSRALTQGLSQHDLSQHGLSQHGLSQRGLSQQGLPQRGLPQQGLSQQGLSQQGLQQHRHHGQASSFDGHPYPYNVLSSSSHPIDDPSSPHESRVSKPHSFLSPLSQKEQDRVEFEQTAEALDELLKHGKYYKGMLHWLQCRGMEQRLFDAVLVKYNPEIWGTLQQPLILLSIGATIAGKLEEPFLPQRMAWMEIMVHTYHKELHLLVSRSQCQDAPSRRLTKSCAGFRDAESHAQRNWPRQDTDRAGVPTHQLGFG